MTKEEQDWEEINEKIAAYDALKAKLRYWFDCEVAMLVGMVEGGQTLAAGPYDEMQETQRELMQRGEVDEVLAAFQIADDYRH